MVQFERLVICAVLILFALSLDPETAHWFRGRRMVLPLLSAAAIVYMGVYMGENIKTQAIDSRVLVRNSMERCECGTTARSATSTPCAR